MRRRHTCGECDWTGTTPLEVRQVWHPCRPRRVRRRVFLSDLFDERTPEELMTVHRTELYSSLFEAVGPEATWLD